MRSAEQSASLRSSPAALRFRLALALVVVVALGLRLWGIHHGLPYIYNPDENAHFVPRAIGMFGHSLDPQYFVNPPAFTYLLHLAFWVRWGSRTAVGDAFATDPSTAFGIARVLAALLGAASVGLLAWAGARLVDRRVGLVAAALLAVAFLPVHYSHQAVNDVPALAPLCLSLVGVAGIYRHGRLRDYALAGAAVGVACATKYTAGIVLLCLLGAAVGARNRARGVALAGACALAGFVVANPYALFDLDMFRDGLARQSEASTDGGGKLGLVGESGILYYLGTLTWGLGWIPALAAAGGAVWLAVKRRRLALVLVPAPLLFLLFMGLQDRFFARWLLPVYPLLCLLAAIGALEALRPCLAWLATGGGFAFGSRAPAVIATALLCAQGLLFAIHNDRVLARPDTRALAREWMVANVPEGTKVVIEPIAPDQWAMDVGHPSRLTRTGHRWAKWRTSNFRGRRVKLEDYERTLSPAMLDRYARGRYCIVLTGSIQQGRALREPGEVPAAVAYYRALERRSRVLYRVSPLAADRAVPPFSFDFSFNGYPLSYDRPGPEVVIRRLQGGGC